MPEVVVRDQAVKLMTPLGIVSAICILVASLPLFWWCFTTMRADMALDRGPEQSLVWGKDRADLLASVAERKADAAEAPAQFEAAAGLARRALMGGPMENKALLVLALDADRRGRTQEAGQMMAVLGARGLRNTQTQLWLGEHALARRDYSEAFMRFDAVLRRDPGLSEVLSPVFAEALDDPAATAPLAVRLAARPPWRTEFLSALANDEKGPAHAETMFATLGRTGAPPSEAEAGALVTAIQARGDYDRARDTWLRLLPGPAPARGLLVYDGGFKGLPGPAPFNWRLGPVNGGISELTRAADGRSALHVQYPAGRRQTFAEQLLVLTPGRYRLSGAALVGDDEAPVTLKWSLVCADGEQALLGEASLDGRGGGWRPFAVAFDVPEGGCVAQQLRLTNRAEDSFASAEAWISNLTIDRGVKAAAPFRASEISLPASVVGEPFVHLHNREFTSQ